MSNDVRDTPSGAGLTPSLKVRALLDERYLVAVAVLLVLVALGAWGVYATHLSPGVDAEEQVVSSWSATGEFDHGATVVNGSEAFPEGSEASNRSVYFTRAMPELEGAYRYRYRAEDGTVDARTRLEFVLRSVEKDNDGDVEEVYWEADYLVDERTHEGLAPGEAHEMLFAVDVTRANERIDRIEERLGTDPGTVQLLVRARTTVEGTVDGEPVEETTTRTLRVEPAESVYRVDGPASTEETHRTVERRSVPVEHGPLRSVGSVLLLLASLGGLAGLSYAGRDGRLLSEEERRLVDHASEREAFDDWISRGRLPDSVTDRPRVEVASLADLVDVAVDSDRRVVESTEDPAYYVVDGDVVYAYEPPAPAEGASTDRRDG